MATFILIHGAWHWGACWQEVRQHLEAAGQTVETPMLLGMGDTASLLTQRPRPRIGVMTHIEQVTEMVRHTTDPSGCRATNRWRNISRRCCRETGCFMVVRIRKN